MAEINVTELRRNCERAVRLRVPNSAGYIIPHPTIAALLDAVEALRELRRVSSSETCAQADKALAPFKWEA